jgi:hypothetical protein
MTITDLILTTIMVAVVISAYEFLFSTIEHNQEDEE